MVVNFYGFYHWLKGKQQDHDIRIEPIATKTGHHANDNGSGGWVNFWSKFKAILPMQQCRYWMHNWLHLVYWRPIGPVRKHIATWVLWVFVDIIYVGMFIYKDLYLTAGVVCWFCWAWRHLVGGNGHKSKINSSNRR